MAFRHGPRAFQLNMLKARNFQFPFHKSRARREEKKDVISLYIGNVKSGKDYVIMYDHPFQNTKQIHLIANAARRVCLKVGHEPDTDRIDFLPPRRHWEHTGGYTFINAGDREDPIPFFDEYNGKLVKSSTRFVRNCAHTQAQGKEAMRIFLMATKQQKMILALKFNT